MRTNIWIAVLLGASLASCTGSSYSSTNAMPSDANATANDDEVHIMSQDECDLRAGDSITAGNCDSEFDKLVREIEADQGGG